MTKQLGLNPDRPQEKDLSAIQSVVEYKIHVSREIPLGRMPWGPMKKGIAIHHISIPRGVRSRDVFPAAIQDRIVVRTLLLDGPISLGRNNVRQDQNQSSTASKCREAPLFRALTGFSAHAGQLHRLLLGLTKGRN